MRLYGGNIDDDESYNDYIYNGPVSYYDNINKITLEEFNKNNDLPKITGGKKDHEEYNDSFDNINDLISYKREKYDNTVNRFGGKSSNSGFKFNNTKLGGAPIATIRLPGNLVNVDSEFMGMKPVDYIIQRIRVIKDNPNMSNLMIVKAGTGTGKSFILPVDIYTSFNSPNIICVQPTVILTTKLAKDVYYNNISTFKMGKTIGYLTSSQKVGSKGLVYVTTGILLLILRRLVYNLDHNINDPNDPQFILVDEAHRRSLEMEVSLVLLNELVIRGQKRAPFIILLSATLNVEALGDYFKINIKDHLIEVSGSTSVRLDTFIDEDSNNIIYDVFDRIKNICDKQYDKLLDDANKL